MRVLINGIEYRGMSGWQISEKVGNPTSTTISVLVENQPIPMAGDVIEVLTDGEPAEKLFFGILGIPATPAYSSPYEQRIYSLNCLNGNSILQRRLANVSYADKTMTQIVLDLYQRYIAPEGVTLGTLSQIDTPTFEIYNCKNMSLMAVMNELAGFIGGAWQITNDKVFNFVRIDDFPRCSQTVTLDNAPFGRLQWKADARDLRTNQIIDGAFLTTDPQTEEVTVTESWQGFLTSFPLIQKPRMWVNSTEVPSDEIGTRGLDDGDTSKLFYWSYNSRQITLNVGYEGSVDLGEGDTVRIVYVGLAPLRYEISNLGKISEIAGRTGLSGIIDNVYTDPTIVTRIDAISKAESLLSQYGDQKDTLTCVTDIHTLIGAGFDAGDVGLYTQWTFDIPELDMVGEYVLTERVAEPLRQDDDGSVRYRLTFTDRDFVQSYGETISRLYKDITKLSVRAEENVVFDFYVEDTQTLAENLGEGTAIALFVAGSMQNGQIAQPLGTIMPNIVHGGGGGWRTPFVVYLATGDGQAVYPLGDAGTAVCC